MEKVVEPKKQKKNYNVHDFIYQKEKISIVSSSSFDASMPHSHEFIELMFVVSGRGQHVVNGIITSVLPGDTFLILPGDIHYFMEGEKIELFYCIWLKEFYPLDSHYIVHERKYSNLLTMDFLSIITGMRYEYNKKDKNYLQVMYNYLDIIVMKMERIPKQSKEEYGLRRKFNLVRASIDYMRKNYKKHIVIEDISAHLKISNVYLSKIFKEQMNQGVIQHLTEIRIEQGLKYLKETSMSIQGIAEHIGFCSSKNFSAIFKAKTGISPNSYRNLCEQNKDISIK